MTTATKKLQKQLNRQLLHHSEFISESHYYENEIVKNLYVEPQKGFFLKDPNTHLLPEANLNTKSVAASNLIAQRSNISHKKRPSETDDLKFIFRQKKLCTFFVTVYTFVMILV